MIEDQYEFLTMAYTDMEFILMKNYLKANGIPVITREKGFGGPIRSIYMGSFMPAHIEVFVKKSDYEKAAILLDYGAFNSELDEELEEEIAFTKVPDPNKKKN
jgi:hypothetical protein